MRISRPTYPRSGRLPIAPCGAIAASCMGLALLLAACGSSEPRSAPRGGALTIYSSLPREGVSSRAADAVADGEALALSDARGHAAGHPVRLVELDSAAPGGDTWDPAVVEANARRAADDPTAIAYLGELDLGGSAVSVPVTSAADLLQVSPQDGLTSLTRPDPAEPEAVPESYYPRGRRNFVRLAPTDAQQAEALVAWVRDGDVRRLAVVRDDSLFGRELAAETTLAARNQHVTVTGVEEARRGAADYVDLAHDVAMLHPDAVAYTGLGDDDGDRVLEALRRSLPGAAIYGSSGLAAAPGAGQAPAADVLKIAAPASRYGPRARAVLSRLRAQRGTPVAVDALYGYEAMRLVLDALDSAAGRAGERTAVVAAAMHPRGRRSLLAGYGADASTARFAGYRRADGRLAFVGLRRAPAPGSGRGP
jgi:branched-chain amino acid transport system substrate-binding protein